MNLFGPKKYLFAAVVFHHGHKYYMYLTKDRTLKTNDVVMVPVTGQEPQPAIVAWVKECTEKDAPYPPKKAKWIIGRADRENAQLFAGMDLRTPLDISVENIRDINGDRVGIVTTAKRREALRRDLSQNPRFRIEEKFHPEPAPEGKRILVIIQDGKAMEIS